MNPQPSLHDTSNIQTPLEDIEQLLENAQQAFHDLPLSAVFNKFCSEQSIDQTNTSTPRYWEAVADFVQQASMQAREAGEDEKAVALRELFAATPDFIYKQKILNHDDHTYAPQDIYDDARERVSYFNDLIRHVAEEIPDIHASALADNLITIANSSISRPDLQKANAQPIRDAIRGAQHELAFGQLLELTGRDFRGANISQDLHGTDYVVTNPDGSTELIDVKASRHTIERHNSSTRPYFRDADGQLTMYSLVTDYELNDTFFIPEKTAEKRAMVLSRILDEASSHGH